MIEVRYVERRSGKVLQGKIYKEGQIPIIPRIGEKVSLRPKEIKATFDGNRTTYFGAEVVDVVYGENSIGKQLVLVVL